VAERILEACILHRHPLAAQRLSGTQQRISTASLGPGSRYARPGHDGGRWSD